MNFTITRRRYSIGLASLVALGACIFAGEREAEASCSKNDETKFSNQWFYTEGFCVLRDSGESILSNAGKQILASSLDAFVPGASAIFGLGGDDPFERYAQQILDAIDASSGSIHDHIDQFWNWAKDTNNAQNTAKVNGALLGVAQWGFLTPSEKLAQPSRLSSLLTDVTLVRQVLSTAVLPGDKVTFLQTYAHIIDIELTLLADQARMDILLPMTSDPRFTGSLEAFHGVLTTEERVRVESDVQTRTRQLWALTLDSGPGAVFPYFEGNQVIDAFSGHTQARFTWRNVNGTETGNPQQCCGSVQTNWKYWVDGRRDCVADRKPSCSGSNPDGGFMCSVYWPYPETRSDACPEFNFNISGSGNFDTVIMRDPAKLMDQHKWVVRGDMLVEAYGPIRRKLDLWRAMLHDTPRAYNPADIAMDRYLGALSDVEADILHRGAWGGVIHPLANTPAVALNSCSARVPGVVTFTPEQYNVAVGFAVDQGLNRLVSLVCGPRLSGQPAPAALHAKALASKNPESVYGAFDIAIILGAFEA